MFGYLDNWTLDILILDICNLDFGLAYELWTFGWTFELLEFGYLNLGLWTFVLWTFVLRTFGLWTFGRKISCITYLYNHRKRRSMAHRSAYCCKEKVEKAL